MKKYTLFWQTGVRDIHFTQYIKTDHLADYCFSRKQFQEQVKAWAMFDKREYFELLTAPSNMLNDCAWCQEDESET